MIAEHTFITTLDAPEAFSRADAFLASLGFAAADPAADSSTTSAAGPALIRRSWARGPRKPSYSPLFRKLQMRLHLDFDRGRINSALSIEHPRRTHKLARPFALTLLEDLEHAAAGAREPQVAAAACRDIIDDARRRDFRRRLIIALVVIPLFVLALFAIIIAVSSVL
ncbi:MAG: hypothetical protein IT436_03565 [Phycisphaerales bacterium]|nr:hypothetical protein [Phycisphaerales bacterium]